MSSPNPGSGALVPREVQSVLTDNEGTAIDVGGMKFASIRQAIEYIETKEPHKRYPMQLELMRAIMGVYRSVAYIVSEFYEYVESSKSWENTSEKVNFHDDFKEARDVHVEHKKREETKAGIKRNMAKRWGGDRVDALFELVDTDWTAKCTRKSINAVNNWDRWIMLVNRAVMNRVTAPGAGKRRTFNFVTGDMQWAVENMSNSSIRPVTNDELRPHGMEIGVYGVMRKRALPRADESMRSIDMVLNSPTRSDVAMGGATRPHSRVPSTASVHSEVSIRSRQPNSPDSRRVSREMTSPPVSPRFLNETLRNQPPSSPAGHVRRSDRIREIAQRQQSVADDDEPLFSIESDDEIEHSEIESVRNAPTKRLCKCVGFETGLLTQIRDTKVRSLTKTLKILEQTMNTMRKDSTSTLCFDHAKLLASKLGLQTRSLNRENLLNRLRHIDDNRLDIGGVKTDDKTFQWFRLANRPPRPEDALGIFRFSHKVMMPKVDAMKTFDLRKLLRITGINTKQNVENVSKWNTVGSVVLHGLMSWWSLKTGGNNVAGGVLREYDIYLHHQRLMGGRENYGWLRTMYHSVGQQLMRQDPAYYLWYVALRNDHAWKFISYPYYAKYTKPGDKTFFRHIDVNVPDAIEKGRGANMIQGSLTLTDEKPGDCTQILPGMHKYVGEWWTSVVKRGLGTGGYVHRIKDAMFTKDDERKYDTKWTDVVCNAYDVRITSPLLPHGAHGPAKTERRTMLPWFVAIQDDHETLEVLEAGTWSQLSAAHRDLIPGPTSPSGHSNRYATVPYAFPAAMRLQGLGAISDALVGQKKWTAPDVIAELDVLFGDDEKAASEYIANWRRRATAAAMELLKQTISLEERVYGKVSHGYCKRNNIPSDQVKEAPVPKNVTPPPPEPENPADHY